MEKKEFEQAPLKEKVFRVFERGRPIATREFLFFRIRLYALYDFLAEVWYIPSSNKIDRVETITTDDVLDLYKSDFDISELLK